VDSHHPPDQVFCAADSELRSLFVEVTGATPNPLAAAGWLVCNLDRFVPAEYEVEFDVRRLRCVGCERIGPRALWHFDASDALTLVVAGA